MATVTDVRDHLQDRPGAKARRAAWNGRASIDYSLGQLMIQAQGDTERYPYGFSFEDLTATDWELA